MKGISKVEWKEGEGGVRGVRSTFLLSPLAASSLSHYNQICQKWLLYSMYLLVFPSLRSFLCFSSSHEGCFDLHTCPSYLNWQPRIFSIIGNHITVPHVLIPVTVLICCTKIITYVSATVTVFLPFICWLTFSSMQQYGSSCCLDVL